MTMKPRVGAHGGGGVAEAGTGSELLGPPPDTVDGAGIFFATEPGSSKASTGAHALGPLTLPGASDAQLASKAKWHSSQANCQGRYTAGHDSTL